MVYILTRQILLYHDNSRLDISRWKTGLRPLKNSDDIDVLDVMLFTHVSTIMMCVFSNWLPLPSIQSMQ